MATLWERNAHSVNHMFCLLCLLVVWVFPIKVSREGILFRLSQFLVMAFLALLSYFRGFLPGVHNEVLVHVN